MLDQNVAAEVLNRAVQTGGDFAEIFLEDSVNSYLSMKSDRIEAVGTIREHGAGIRVFEGTKAIYVFTNDTSREGLMDCAAQAAAAVRCGKGCKPVWFSRWNAGRTEEIRLLPGNVAAARKAEKMRAANAAARAVSPEIVQVNCGFGDVTQDILICNTEGVFVTDRRVRSRLRVAAVASDGKENQTGTRPAGSSFDTDEFFEAALRRSYNTDFKHNTEANEQ